MSRVFSIVWLGRLVRGFRSQCSRFLTIVWLGRSVCCFFNRPAGALFVRLRVPGPSSSGVGHRGLLFFDPFGWCAVFQSPCSLAGRLVSCSRSQLERRSGRVARAPLPALFFDNVWLVVRLVVWPVVRLVVSSLRRL